MKGVLGCTLCWQHKYAVLLLYVRQLACSLAVTSSFHYVCVCFVLPPAPARAAVNCLATTANGAILLSGSDDETVKVGGQH